MRNHSMVGLCLLLAFAGTGLPAAANDAPDTTQTELIPARTFVRFSQVMSPRLSPDGKHLAVRTDDEDGASHQLVIYELPEMKVLSILKMPKYTLPLDTTWVNNEWLVVAKGKAFGSLGQPAYTGEIIASDISGKQQRYLWGFETEGRRAQNRQDDGSASIQGLPEELNGHFYMTVQPWGNQRDSILYDVDAVNNTRHLLTRLNVYGMDFLVDPDGKPSFASGVDNDYERVTWQQRGDTWLQLDSERTGVQLTPIAYLPGTDDTILAGFSRDGGPLNLISEKADGSQRTVLVEDAFASVDSLQWSAYPRQPFAVSLATGRPQPTYIKPKLKEAAIYEKLRQTFPDAFVQFINFSRDGGKLLFRVSSDRLPGIYYLLDTNTFKATELFSARPWINPQQMAERRPIIFTASDGLQLEGYLTLPPGRGEQNLPLVLLPHGGPHGVRDSWFFDSDSQFLANRGYAVLQVNFRGSSGRGANFEQAGYRHWGDRIQQDLIDGVQWAIDQHYADPKRICTYGASFGGYSALMAVIRAPKLFQCAIGYAGVYDLNMMVDKSDIRRHTQGRSYLDTVLGSDKAELGTNSPVNLVDQINVPVLLIHGTRDERAPYAGAKAMRSALEKAHKPVEWMSGSGEDHGFYDTGNNVQRLDKIEAFLGKYIGKQADAES